MPCKGIPLQSDTLINLAINTWFRFLVKEILHTAHKEIWVENEKDYQWVKLNIFTQWNTFTKKSIVIVFDARPPIKTSLIDLLTGAIDFISLEDSYFSHILLAKKVLRLYNDAVWSIRNSVRFLK